MDEADRLCDRIAIVDHGKLVALDSPAALKTSVPGNNVVEVQFGRRRPMGGAAAHLPGVDRVQDPRAGMYRLLTSNGSQTTTGLVELAVRAWARSRRSACRTPRSTTFLFTTPDASCATSR
jgi:ABC-2 type transport system ATP-binding protein